VGKTLVARALANYLARISGFGRSDFMYIKPSQDNSYLFSQSERNIRKRFRAAAEAAERSGGAPVVMFFDEIDAMGAARGARLREVNDRVLQAFLAELQGLNPRSNVLVIGATNRADALDPALVRPGRLGDSLIEIPRPGRRAAREIFGKYLTDDLCYAKDPEVESMRASVIDAGVSAIFASNGDGELARLTFRDGSTRPVHRADLVNGSVIANIAGKACRIAWRRDKRGGEPGVRPRDVLAAVAEEFQALAGILTPVNCRSHLSGIPWDLDVVDVAQTRRRVARPLNYMRIGA
jgi:proteasome-associated ATPase